MAARFALVLLLLLPGCASDGPLLHFSMPVPARDGPMWPAPPSTPRYAWLGNLTGENAPAHRQLRGVLGAIAGVEDSAPDRVKLQRPQGIWVDATGRILVTDMGQGAVFVFDPAASTLQLWQHAGGADRLISPIGIVASGDRVYVADPDLGAVVVFSATGDVLARIGADALERPIGVAIDESSSTLWVSDSAANRLVAFGLDGTRRSTLGGPGTAAGEFNAPTYLAFARGELYVTDTLNARIQVIDTTTFAVRELGKRGLYVGNLSRPKGVGIDSEGNVYVAESYFDYLLVFDHDGNLLLPIGGSGDAAGHFFQPTAIHADAEDRIYVADLLNGRIVMLQYLRNPEPAE